MTATLRDVPTWDALADLYGKVAHDDEAAGLVMDEAKRRERLEHARRARKAVQGEWVDAAHAQYMAAEDELRGNLVRAGSPVTDAWSLWSGSERYAMCHASEELQLWWLDHPRLTVTAYRDQIADGRRVQRDEAEAAALDANHDDTEVRETTMTEQATGRATAFAARREQLAQECADRAEQYRGQIAVRTGSAVASHREPVDGDETLRYIYTFLKRFAVWGSEAEIVTATLWVAQSHARDARGMPIWQYCARLGIFGPSGSGKSWKARLVGKLCYKGEILVEPTKPAFIDMCADHHTVILTEADEAFRSPGRSRGILAVVNAAYEPDRSSTRKQGGVAVKIPLFVPMVLDGIDTLLSATRPDLRAMISRCIIIMARQAPEGYRPPRFDAKARAMAELLSQRTTAWMAQEIDAGMADDVPDVPEHLGNRPFALWEPLFICALRADKGDPDGPWSVAVRDACEQLESSLAVPEPDEDAKSELDRIMAEWEGE